MQRPWRVTAAKLVTHGVLHVEFADGVSGLLDMRPLLSRAVNMLVPLTDPAVFAQFRVNEGNLDTVTWPNGYDICPETMHRAIRGAGKLILG